MGKPTTHVKISVRRELLDQHCQVAFSALADPRAEHVLQVPHSNVRPHPLAVWLGHAADAGTTSSRKT